MSMLILCISMDTSPLYTSVNSINRFRTVHVVHTVHGLEEDHQADCIAAGMAQHGLFIIASGTSCGECTVWWHN